MSNESPDDQRFRGGQAVQPVAPKPDLNTPTDPFQRWGRAAELSPVHDPDLDAFLEHLDERDRVDPACRDHLWPPLDEDDPRCDRCFLPYDEWSV
ncbi:hypothetical protein GCM10022225_51170 [Plantactinospora mayteni]|uniref:Uncharacterized protein n=1 Tax=Plantactinospora mayteni TaxID=566021 RepID=A0ABQ4F464_9ACTN|nr:hypothetical protein [Plantactinospora mayteni]GIH01704.1 hypothetical protein Pma05_82760 [Plantactinospora mayteni]